MPDPMSFELELTDLEWRYRVTTSQVRTLAGEVAELNTVQDRVRLCYEYICDSSSAQRSRSLSHRSNTASANQTRNLHPPWVPLQNLSTPRVSRIEDRLFINGEFVPSKSGKKFDVFNPTTEKLCASVYEAGPEDVDIAVAAAKAAFPAWSDLGAADRAGYIEKLAQKVSEHRKNSPPRHHFHGQAASNDLSPRLPSPSCATSLAVPST